jgi:hypothetical protein
MTKLKISRTMDQIEKHAKIRGSFWNFTGIKLNWFLKLDSIEGITEQIQKIGSEIPSQ